MTPIQCRTEAQIAKLSHAIVCVGDFSISVDCAGYHSSVEITEQKLGNAPKQSILIPKAVFNKLARWYVDGKVPIEDAKSRRPPK